MPLGQTTDAADLAMPSISATHSFLGAQSYSFCLSTAEAEYVGATEVCKEVMYLCLALSEVGYRQDEPTIVHKNNTACISMVKNKIVSATKNKHMELKMHFVREQVERKVVQLKKISTQKQRAELLTKLRLAMLDPKLYDETFANTANVC